MTSVLKETHRRGGGGRKEAETGMGVAGPEDTWSQQTLERPERILRTVWAGIAVQPHLDA